MTYAIGDMVYFRIHGSGGEGMFIGRLKGFPGTASGEAVVEHGWSDR